MGGRTCDLAEVDNMITSKRTENSLARWRFLNIITPLDGNSMIEQFPHEVEVTLTSKVKEQWTKGKQGIKKKSD